MRSVAAAVTGKCGKHGKPTATTANATVSEISCCDGGGHSLEDPTKKFLPDRVPKYEVERLS